MINKLTDILKEIKYIGGLWVKQSFEDEGISIEDFTQGIQLANSTGLNTSIKIGGCEARSDIDICNKYHVNNIVAPMIESDFALEKFIHSTEEIEVGKYINVESKQAIMNLDLILKSPWINYLDGITIGRSDLSKSYGLEKKDVDSEKIHTIVRETLKKIKNIRKNNLSKLITTIGGNITTNSAEFISDCHSKDYLDRFETRNIIFNLHDMSVEDITDGIKLALEFEKLWLQYKFNVYNETARKHGYRLDIISRRMNDK